MIQPINPYVAGAPVQGKKFFGRQDILHWLERGLRNPATNGLVLFSQRRIGRTSILLQLQRTLPANDFLPVYFDLQYQAARPLGQVLADLADTAAWQVDLDFPDPDKPDDQGRFFRREFLPQFYQALGENRRPVFLLDEFDVLNQVAETEPSETATAKALFPFLRRVMTEDSRPVFVFAVGRWLEDLSLDFTAIFKSALVREVWVLDQKDAEALVRQAEANDTLRFTSEAVARILSLTSGHPFFTQLLCQRIWEQAYASNPSTPPQIDAPNVEAAIPDALETSDQALVWLWNGLSQDEKICAAALAELAGEKETISASQIIQALTDHTVRLRKQEVKSVPRALVKRRLLEQVKKNKYHFAIELLRRWIRQNKPLFDVKEERTVPVRPSWVEPVAEPPEEPPATITGQMWGLLALLFFDFCLALLFFWRTFGHQSAFFEILGVGIAIFFWIWSIVSEDFLHHLRTDRVWAHIILGLTVLFILIALLLGPVGRMDRRRHRIIPTIKSSSIPHTSTPMAAITMTLDISVQATLEATADIL